MFGRLHVLPIINEFLAGYTEINVRLVLSDRNVHLIDDHIDMAVRIGVLPDSSMAAMRVGSVRRVVCGSPAYFARHGIPHTAEDLSRLAAVTFDGLGSAASWNLSMPDSRAEKAVPILARLSVNTAEAAIDAAIAGAGVTRVLSYQIERALGEGKLEIVLENYEPEPLPVNLIHSGQEPLPLKLRSFLDFAVPGLRHSLRGGLSVGALDAHLRTRPRITRS